MAGQHPSADLARLDLFLRSQDVAEQYGLDLPACARYILTPLQRRVLEARGWFADWRRLASLADVGRALGMARSQVYHAEMLGLQRLINRLAVYRRHVEHPPSSARLPASTPKRTRGRRPRRAVTPAPGRPVHRGILRCLRCDRRFKSWDVRENRLCWRCRPQD